MNFKIGDRVSAKGYCGVLIIDSKDEFLSKVLRKTHWNTVSEDYINGKIKTNNGESYSEDELTIIKK